MSNPTSGWDKVPITAVYKLVGGGFDSGSVSFTLSKRITAVDGSAVWPRGQTITVPVSATDGALSLQFPANDDPDITPNGWSIHVVENLKSGGGQSYDIYPTLADGGVNLNSFTVS